MEETASQQPNGTSTTLSATTPPAPAATPALTPEELRQRRKMVIGISAAVLVFFAFIFGSVYLLLLPTTQTDKIRDVFIIFMAVESLLIGLVLVILIVQLAQLINLLQNEIKPILNSTNETVNTLRGTAVFLSDNLTEPVMKLNEFLAALNALRDTLGFNKRK
ncbi:MAG TPA: hypothetical protein PK530_10505 [Anaerolineales bacterium]|nr:hypothetical protein [Anaerolineales bacterium]